MEESDLKDMSFASHMSFLTNKRLHELFMMRDAMGVEAGTTFAVEMIMAYGSSLDAIFKEIESVLDESQRYEVLSIFSKYKNLLYKENKTIQDRYKMYEMLSVIHRLMNSYLQMFQYFFRIEAKPLKGIRNTIKMMGWDKDESISGVAKK